MDRVLAPDPPKAGTAAGAPRISKAVFAEMVAIAADAIIAVDQAQRILYFNQGAEQVFGYAAEDVLGRPLDILVPEEARAVHRTHVDAFGRGPVAARRMGERSEIAGLRRNGEVFPAEASISKLDIDGERIYTVVLRDITERKRIEVAQQFLARAGTTLAASLDYQATLESIARLAVPILADWSVIYVADEAGGVRCLEMAHADPEHAPLLAELRRFPVTAAHPAHTVFANREPVFIADVPDAYVDEVAADAEHAGVLRRLGMRSLIVVPLIAHGRVRGSMGFFRASPSRRHDLDDLALARELALIAALAFENARLYDEAKQAIRARDDVLAVVSHDLGNPLSAIRIGTTLLLKHRPPEEDAAGGWRHLEGIRQSVEQMERLIHSLLEVKRLEAGHLVLDRRSHRPAHLIRAAAEALAPLAEARRIRLEHRCADSTPPVLADRERVLQVFSNLIGNALKFTGEAGRVMVEATAQGAEVRFAVADTGVGIEPDALPHIFDRFWKAKREGGDGPGIGLGLAICKGIVEAHGGRIWAESEPGNGTTVHFTLPTSREA